MGEELKEKLFNKKVNGWESVTEQEKEEIFELSKNYINFLNKAKIEREFVKEAIKLAEKKFIFGNYWR